MSEHQQLLDRRVALQQEQAELRQRLTDWRTRLTVLADIRREALKRFDVGHDDAKLEADTALDETLTIEATIARAERQLSEYGPRMHALNLEIEKAGYRDRCKQLLALQQLEREAWQEFARVLPDFYEAWFAYAQTRAERRVLARSLSSYAGTAGMTSPPSGDFPAPSDHDLKTWFDLKTDVALEQVEGAITKANAVIGA